MHKVRRSLCRWEISSATVLDSQPLRLCWWAFRSVELHTLSHALRPCGSHRTVSERSYGEPLQVRSEVVVSNRGKSANEGTFHAAWQRENPTKEGQPFTYVHLKGRGHPVAAIRSISLLSGAYCGIERGTIMNAWLTAVSSTLSASLRRT